MNQGRDQQLQLLRPNKKVTKENRPIAERSSYQNKLFILIAITALVRIVLAEVIEIGNDEAYYWYFTKDLQWNYFDHPPMVAVWGRFFTLNGTLDHLEVFVRLGSIVGCALSTFFIFKAVASFQSERAAWFAAILYNTSFYAGMVAGLLIMPDSPQMIFWTFCMWMIARIIQDDRSFKAWLLFGVSAGLCIMSKVHGIFIWSGLGLYGLLFKRDGFLSKNIYTSLLLTILVASPIFIWNFNNDFVTYKFHSQRVNIIGWAIHPDRFLTEVIGQFFFNNPVNVIITWIASVYTIRKWNKTEPATKIFLFSGLSLVVLLLFISVFRPILPHWSGPGYVALIPVAAVYIANKYPGQYPIWIKSTLVPFIVFVVAWPSYIHFYPGSFGNRTGESPGKGDVSLDRYGWKEGGKAFTIFFNNQVSKGNFSSHTPVVTNTWWGAHVEYYFCKQAGLEMIGLGDLNAIHHYMWTNYERKNKVNFNKAICILPSDEYYDPIAAYRGYYNQVQPIDTIDIFRMNKKAKSYYIYELSGWKNNLPQIKH
jgi:hypothetical protein